MLRFITGAVCSDADRVFSEHLAQSCKNGENVLVIIPDQFSFEYDKKLYSLLGAKDFNRIRTAGFNRLAGLIGRSCGGSSEESANENARIITMFKAVRRLKETGDVRFYSRALEKGSFAAQMIDLIAEMIRSGITPADLQTAAERLDGTVSLKLYDLHRLYAFYLEELAASGLKDALTSLGECVRLVRDNGYFRDMSIYIDAFSGFTRDEYDLIEQMIVQARSVTISLIISGEKNAAANRTPFAATVRTRADIERLAMAHGKRFEEENVRISGSENISAAIMHIDKNMYLMQPDKISAEGAVRLLSANDIYEETEFVCAEIMRLVREEGYSFRDIAVAARSLDSVSAALEGSFERYDIPYFIDRRQSAEQSALAIYLNSIFDCVLSGKYRTENILRYIKSPLCAVLDFDVRQLEDYCLRWSVEGDMWLEDFTASDGGKYPEHINEIRREVIEPLERFKNSCKDVSAGEICTALYELLEKIRLSEQIYSVVKRAGGSVNETDLELGREFRQLWQTILGAVQSIYENMKDEKISLRRFCQLFRLMVSQMTVSTPPQKIDSVRCAGAERSRLSNVRALFVIEVNDGIFPAQAGADGLLTQRDRRLMEETGISLINGAANFLDGERLTAYLTFTVPTQKLYVISTQSDLKGSVKNPSELAAMTAEMFDDVETEKIPDIPPEFFCASYKSAYYKYLELSKDETALIRSSETPTAEKKEEDGRIMRRADMISTIRFSLSYDDHYSQRLEWVKKNASAAEHKIDKKTARELFFANDLNISATRLTNFYKCPFMYFCKYGLKLRKSDKVSFDSMYRGNIMHRCLERIMSREESGERVYCEEFVTMDEAALRERIHDEFEKYIEEEMGGGFGKNSRFMHEVARYEKTAYHIVRLLQEELKDSLFRPAAFEFDLTKEDGESILKLKFDEDCSIALRGKIDRADIYEDADGRRFLRIVDYKTGLTDFDLAAIYNGLNMQMLLYLLALTKSENRLNPDGKLEPSAIMYSHIKEFSAKRSPSDDQSDEKVFLARAADFKPDGMMVDDKQALDALNKNYGGAFTMFRFNKDGSISKSSEPPVDAAYFSALGEFVLRKVSSAAKRLSEGKIDADPIQTGKGRNAKIPCTYCEYFDICGKGNPRKPRIVDDGDKEKLDEEIMKIAEEGAK